MAHKKSLHIGITEQGQCEVTGPLDDLELCMLLMSDALRVIVQRKRKKDEPLIQIPRAVMPRVGVPGNGGRR